MLIQKRHCDFCKKRISLNSQDYEFPYMGSKTTKDAPTYSTINLCDDCIERIKQLRDEIFKNSIY